MRTANPASIRVDYLQALTELENTYNAVESARGPSAADEKRVAANMLLAAAALWESFLSDLVVAYVNVDASQFKTFVEARYSLSTSVNSDQEEIRRASMHVSAVMKGHLTLSEIRDVLAGSAQNVTFKSVGHLKHKAESWLSPAHHAHFDSITDAKGATMEAWRAIRNFVAHRNTGARNRMNDKLNHAQLPASLRRGPSQVHAPGSYLRAKLAGTRRLILYFNEMRAIANTVCP